MLAKMEFFICQICTQDILRHILGPVKAIFSNMSIFDASRAVGLILRKWVPSENKIYLQNGWPMPAFLKLA